MSKSPNVILLVLDTLRYDFAAELGAFNRLAGKGWTFDRMYAPGTFTNSIMPSVRSGMYPPRHGRRAWRPKGRGWEAGGHFREGELWTIEDHMHRAGYKVFSDSQPGGVNAKSVTMKYFRNPSLISDVLAKSQPFYLYTHYMVLHNMVLETLGTPKNPMRYLPGGLPRKTYKAMLPKMDRFLGTAVRRLTSAGLLDNTLLIVFGDHGFGLVGDRHPIGAGLVLDFRVRVPCVMVGPGLERRRIGKAYSLIDLLPSVLDYLKIQRRPPKTYLQMHGCSVFRSSRKPPYVYMEAQSPNSEWPSNWPNVFGATNGVVKVMGTPGGYECYDLKKDSHEKNPDSGLLKRADVKAMIGYIAKVKAEGGRGPSPTAPAKKTVRKPSARKIERPEVLMVYRGPDEAPFSIRGQVSKLAYRRVRKGEPFFVRREDIAFMEKHGFENIDP